MPSREPARCPPPGSASAGRSTGHRRGGIRISWKSWWEAIARHRRRPCATTSSPVCSERWNGSSPISARAKRKAKPIRASSFLLSCPPPKHRKPEPDQNEPRPSGSDQPRLARNSLSGLLQAALQCFLRKLVQDGAQQFCHQEGNVARQRDGLAGDEHAAVTLLEKPIAADAPHEPAIVTGRQFVLVMFTRIGDLNHPPARGAAVGALGVERNEVNLVVDIEHVGNEKFRFHYPGANQEIAAGMRLHLDVRHVGLV